MSLQKGKYSEVPSDAIRLTKEEAIEHQFKLMTNWKHKKDTFFFRYGSGILGGAVVLTSIYVTSYYRRKLLLHKKGHFSSYLPTVTIPTVVAMLGHMENVLPRIVLQEDCSVCTEIKASSVQVAAGVLMPITLGSLVSFSVAANYGTYDLPYLTQKPLQLLKTWKTLTKPIGNKLFAIFLAHAMLASVITKLEHDNVQLVTEKIDFLHRQFGERNEQMRLDSLMQ